MEDTKNDKAIPKPENRSHDFGKIILPSENLAAIQKIIETTRPITSKSPFEELIGICAKGRKKTGRNTITAKSDQKEILSKTFDNILFYSIKTNKSDLVLLIQYTTYDGF